MRSQRFKKLSRITFITLGSLIIVSASLVFPASASPAQQNTLTPTSIPSVTPTFDINRLAKPKLPEVLDQADEGQLIFWGICMACHGDRGQGLTDEWRIGAYAEDSNCWESNCHGPDHPTPGFEIPKKLIIPPVGTTGALGRFNNAQQLYDYVVKMMPWWNPASLTSEKAWQVTAYLLKMKGSLPEGLVLNETNASAVPVYRHITPPENKVSGILIFTGVLILAMIGWLAGNSLRYRAVVSPADPKPARASRPSFIAHLHPPTIPAQQARWRYTLGAGGIAVFLSLILVMTGLLEMFYYVPTPDKAAISIETINSFVPYGAFVRNLHYWSAQILVLVALVHLARVIFTGAYSSQRKFNFLLGLGLLIFILLLDFTGYVLRWDEGIRWALTAGTNLLKSIPMIGDGVYVFVMGSSQPGPAALIRFYSWHIFVLALAGGIFIIWHLFRVRRDGGIATPPPRQREDPRRITRFELLEREIIAMFVVAIGLIVLSTFVPAPISLPIQGNSISEAESNAPWFFLWVQQLLKGGNPFLLGVLLPLCIIIGIGSMPYVFRRVEEKELGHWFPRSGRTVQIIFTVIAAAIIVLTILAFLSRGVSF